MAVSRTCLRYAEARFKADGPETVHFRNKLARPYRCRGIPRSEGPFRAVAGHRPGGSRAEHPDALYAMKGLNAVVQTHRPTCRRLGQRARKFLAAVEAQPDPKPSEVIFALNGLAVALQNTEHYTEAREVYLRALDVARQKLGSEIPIIASTLGNFSTTLLAHKQYSEATIPQGRPSRSPREAGSAIRRPTRRKPRTWRRSMSPRTDERRLSPCSGKH